MADQDLRIKVSAETGAAQDALGKLADEAAGLAKASEKAGSEQQKLARQVADTTGKVEAARQAVERAKRAETEAAQITRAFGAGSREAAEAQQRLRQAEDAATKATREAERALVGAATAVSTLAKATDEKGAAAIRRMNDQLQRVGRDADKAATELRILETRMQSTGKTVSTFDTSTAKSGESVSMLGSMAGKVAPLLGGLLAGAVAAAVANMREWSAETMAMETAMANLPFGLEKARKSTMGLVNDQDLAKSAAQGLALGVVTTEEEFARLAEAATKLGIKLGIGPNQALDNMMTALGRGSTEILDNLGVAMKSSEAYDRYAKSLGKAADELTDAEKKVAFKTEAIKALTDAANKTVIKTDSAAAAIQRLGVQSDNAAASAKNLAVELAGGTLNAWDKFKDSATVDDDELAAMVAFSDEARKVQAATLARNAAEAEFARNWHEVHGQLKDMSDAEYASMKAVGQAAYDNAHTLGTLDGELLKHWETVKGFTASLFDQANAYAQNTKAIRDAEEAETRWYEEHGKRLAKQEDEKEFERRTFIGPELPPGFVRPKEKKAKKPKDLRLARHEFDSEVEDFAFETGQKIREADNAAAAAAVEAESTAREQNIKLLEEEVKAYEAAAEARNIEVDAIFFTLEVKSEAAMRADELRDEQLRKEEQHARWLQKNAKTDEQREKAQTKIMEVENKKRVASIQKTLDEEARIQAKRQKVMEVVTGAVTTLGEGMVSAFEAMAKGEEGAVAKMLSDVLKGVAKKHAVLSLAEFALAAGSAASYNFPAAAAHAAAGGMHAGVAVAAGVGAVAAGKVWEARRDNGETNSSGGSGGSGSGGKGSSSPFGPASGSDPGASGEDGLEAQQVPISHEQLRRQDATVRRNSAVGGPTVNISGTVNIYGAGGKREFIEEIRRGIEQSERGGKRARI